MEHVLDALFSHQSLLLQIDMISMLIDVTDGGVGGGLLSSALEIITTWTRRGVSGLLPSLTFPGPTHVCGRCHALTIFVS